MSIGGNGIFTLKQSTLNVKSHSNSSQTVISLAIPNTAVNVVLSGNNTTFNLNTFPSVINVSSLTNLTINSNSVANTYSYNITPIFGSSILLTLSFLDSNLQFSNSGGGGNSTPFGLPLLFNDGFESGDLTHTQNSISWASSGSTVVSNLNSNGGTRSLKYTFASGATSTAEQRFDLGQPYVELVLMFDLYYPDGTESYGGAAFAEGPSNPNNNKFFRLWRGTQSDGNNGYDTFDTKTGASTLRNNTGNNRATLIQEYGKNLGGVGEFGSGSQADAGSFSSFVTLTDLGHWMNVQIHVQAATSAGNNGIIETWKNGTKIMSANNLDIYPSGGDAKNGFDFGYLLGFADSGFVSTTILFIDNVKIYGR
jgi:hypothetical protein